MEPGGEEVATEIDKDKREISFFVARLEAAELNFLDSTKEQEVHTSPHPGKSLELG